jgi:hypothetical protein
VDKQTIDPLRNEVESAQFLGIKPTTLQVWRSTKRYPLAFVKVGRLVRYRQSALDAFVQLGVMLDDLGTKALPLDRLDACPPSTSLKRQKATTKQASLDRRPNVDCAGC